MNTEFYMDSGNQFTVLHVQTRKERIAKK